LATNLKSSDHKTSTDTLLSVKGIPAYVGGIVLAVLGFFVAIQFIGISFQSIGKDIAESFVVAFSNPAIGLFIGLVSTAILQSSSTTTSMVVAAVAAGSISLENAIPVVMGANIGTTLTSTIVSMSYITKSSEFRKAVSAGAVHDIFNILTCIILLPLELKFGLLSNLSRSLTEFFNISSPSNNTTRAYPMQIIDQFGHQLVDWFGAFFLLIISVILLFAIVKFISNILYKRLIGNTKSKFETIAFENTFKSFGWGFLLTSIIQSSSLTTSLIVPLVATGKVKLNRAFQFIVGANLGTTITALLAAIFKSEAAISLAIAHLLFNSFGMILFLGVPLLKKLPIHLASKLGEVALKYKLTGFAYILGVFFLLPFTLIYFSKKAPESTEANTSPKVELIEE
jgi:sodium-dependent phosphate cotransporter